MDMAINYPDGGGNNPYVPDFTNLNVEPADLSEFADLLDGDVKAIKDTWERLQSDMASQPPPNFPGEHPVGFNHAAGYPEKIYDRSGGIYEAREFDRAYRRTVDAERMLVRDLIRGLEMLRDAARMIHDGYVASDAANVGNLEGTFAAYERSAVTEALGQPDQQTEGKDAEE